MFCLGHYGRSVVYGFYSESLRYIFGQVHGYNISFEVHKDEVSI